MSKRNLILGGNKMLCVKHIVKVEKVPQPEKERPVKAKRAVAEPKMATEKKPREAKGVKESREGKDGEEVVEVKQSKRLERRQQVSQVPEKERDRPAKRIRLGRSESKAGQSSPKKDRHRDTQRSEDLQLGKRAKISGSDKKGAPNRAENPSKRLKISVESNQKLAFNLYKPFDYSTYRKVT